MPIPELEGLVERRAVAGEVVVGDIVSGGDRQMDKWLIIGTSHGVVGEQIPLGCTLWWRARNLKTDEEVSIKPRRREATLRLMVTEEVAEAKQMPERPITWPVDSDEMALLIHNLGATEIGTRDHKTGVVTSPFEYHLGDWGLHKALHLELAHGVNLDGLSGHDLSYRDLLGRYRALREEHGMLKGHAEARRLYPDVDLTKTQLKIMEFHSLAHDPRHPTFGKGGFPHIHVDTFSGGIHARIT